MGNYRKKFLQKKKSQRNLQRPASVHRCNNYLIQVKAIERVLKFFSDFLFLSSFPGLWEVPMIDYTDLRGIPCNMIDGCHPPANEQEAYDLLS